MGRTDLTASSKGFELENVFSLFLLTDDKPMVLRLLNVRGQESELVTQARRLVRPAAAAPPLLYISDYPADTLVFPAGTGDAVLDLLYYNTNRVNLFQLTVAKGFWSTKLLPATEPTPQRGSTITSSQCSKNGWVLSTTWFR